MIWLYKFIYVIFKGNNKDGTPMPAYDVWPKTKVVRYVEKEGLCL